MFIILNNGNSNNGMEDLLINHTSSPLAASSAPSSAQVLEGEDLFLINGHYGQSAV